jgi:hypothetical protein
MNQAVKGCLMNQIRYNFHSWVVEGIVELVELVELVGQHSCVEIVEGIVVVVWEAPEVNIARMTYPVEEGAQEDACAVHGTRGSQRPQIVHG